MRRGDQTVLFTVRLRAFLGTTGTIVDASRRTIARLRQRKRDYFAIDESDLELTRFNEVAEGVLTGPHGELIVRETPVDGEAIRLKFATQSPELRATMMGIAALYHYVNY